MDKSASPFVGVHQFTGPNREQRSLRWGAGRVRQRSLYVGDAQVLFQEP